MVAALGGAGMLVAVSHECDYPPEVAGLPRVTSTDLDTSLPSGEIDRLMAAAKRTGTAPIDVDVGMLSRLRPDVLIGQSVCNVCAVGEAGLERVLGSLHPVPWLLTLHPHTLGEVLADIPRVGETLGLRDEADELAAGLRYRARRLRNRPHPANPPKVLVLEWIDPPYVAGHWVPELVALAGGIDVGNTAGAPSVPRSWAELRRLAPDVVIVALCGFDVARARTELDRVTDDDAHALLRAARVELLDGNAYTSRPGPRLLDAAELLARWITGA
jgi:iron complex transport system substrate-binding protein